MSTDQVLEQLRAGNGRFVERQPKARTRTPAETAGGQSPPCIVLSCADSRVPPEMVFDQDIADLFVVRVAGNVASDDAIASIEYAAAHLGSSVLLVMGHTGCGAVSAACENVDDPEALPTESLRRLVRKIVPSVRDTADGDAAGHVNRAVVRNLDYVAEELRKSPILAQKESEGALALVKAVYDLATGRVEFLG